MKSIPTSLLQPDGYFSAPVFLDEGYILVAPDIRITAQLITRLQKWQYGEVLSEGAPVDKPSYLSEAAGVSRLASLDDDIRERQRLEESQATYAELTEFATGFYRSFHDHNTLNIAELTETLKKAMSEVKANRSTILRFGELEGPSENYLVPYSVNTTLLTMAIGEFLKYPPHKLLELGIAAFLHDIGMTKVPQSILASGKPLTAEEKKAMMYHTVIGYKLLRAYSLAEVVALSALEHHERIDGSGYPRRVPPAKLSLTGKIVAVTGSYIAATSRRRYKAARDGNAAIRDLFAGKKYDPSVLRALVCTLSLYPLGSYVLLSNQAQGMVVDSNPATPRLPMVKMLLDPSGTPLAKSAIVQTAEDGSVSVSRSLTRQETERLKSRLGK